MRENVGVVFDLLRFALFVGDIVEGRCNNKRTTNVRLARKRRFRRYATRKATAIR